jgi:GNAT superfamily N-acetyltransferase
MLSDARPEDAAEMVRVLIRAKEESFPQLVDAHDRNFDFWHDRWRLYLAEGSIYVLLSHQGRGIGTRLLREIVRRLQADGSRSLCVGYSPRNPYKRFYSKHGAVEINPHWAAWRSLPPAGPLTGPG